MGCVRKKTVPFPIEHANPHKDLILQTLKAVIEHDAIGSSIPVPEWIVKEAQRIIGGLNPRTTIESVLAVQAAASHLIGLRLLPNEDMENKRLSLLFLRHSCDCLQYLDKGRHKEITHAD